MGRLFYRGENPTLRPELRLLYLNVRDMHDVVFERSPYGRITPTAAEVHNLLGWIKQTPWVAAFAHEGELNLNLFIGGGDQLPTGLVNEHIADLFEAIRVMLMNYIKNQQGWDTGEEITESDWKERSREIEARVLDLVELGSKVECVIQPEGRETDPDERRIHIAWDMGDFELVQTTDEFILMPDEPEETQPMPKIEKIDHYPNDANAVGVHQTWVAVSRDDLLEAFKQTQQTYPTPGYGTSMRDVRQAPASDEKYAGKWLATFYRSLSCD